MKPFLDADFLLHSETARYLYHEHAAKMPIIDYHCHLSAELIAKDHRFENLTQAWLYGDHYKWRAMRAHGIGERFITGNASDEEKFEKWAETVPFTMRNPLYHWTHLELQRYFGIMSLLSPVTAHSIYHSASDLLRQPEFSVRGLLEMMQVEVICTTDDPLDSLQWHQQIASSGWNVKVYPTWRPDKVTHTSDPKAWNQYVDQLSSVTGLEIASYKDLMAALKVRHDFFHMNGCRLSDHGLETLEYTQFTDEEIDLLFKKLRSHFVLLNACPSLTGTENCKLITSLLTDLARFDHEKGWTQQFHLGAQRNNNFRAVQHIGPDSGFDSIGDRPVAEAMARFLDHLERESKLTRTILYNLNPADNEVFASMIGNFQDGSVPGKIQWGSGWWFLDQKDGMEKQINALSNFGLLSHFIGMLTDSRSFLSYPRHEYFRRILSNLIGQDVENGELPNDLDWLGKMVENICYHNAKNFFHLHKTQSPNHLIP